MASSKYPSQTKYQLSQPEWTKNAVIYQVNTRQFSEKGNFAGVRDKLEHIKELGTELIWLMPIHPIGEKNRKGTLGSPYAVKDYFGINPEFGNEEDFQQLVAAIHQLGMKVIIDWVPNHSAWDNPLVQTHPEWYARDYKGDFRPCPWWDWDDIIEFDYEQGPLRDYMIDALCYWVKTFDIDGFRCDVAGYVPNDFWEQARQALEQIKPVFMLAEWENRDLHEKAFNMTYAWSWNEVLFDIVEGKLGVDKIRKYYAWNERAWPKSAYRMTFVSNHDENAWEGTQHEKFGEALEACIVLSVLGEGMPLIYNSQEAGETKRLAFFERDPIEWQDHPIGDLYRHLIALKKQNPALWNGPYGATMIQVPCNAQDQVLSFVRHQGKNKIWVTLNLSKQRATPTFSGDLYRGDYYDPFDEKNHDFNLSSSMSLSPWGYRVLVSK